ncbi:hypothetical protein ZIOFF_023044 [Zingiber officinale]|uniref:EF-hand domain-containing protein n=1 Tax=Zingiber officinale TaxID=94328 RepID=A0A8J5HNE4_ZINOF|nr:hypothetical protein ZIOFF_023044 [Zingiber officinale]
MGNASAMLTQYDIEEVQDHCNYLFSQQEIVALYSRFCQLDRTAKGFISSDEFLSIPEFSLNPLSQRLLKMVDGLNFKDFVAFLSAFSPQATTQQKIEFIFKVYDADGKGRVTFKDLLEVLRDLTGSFMSEEQREVTSNSNRSLPLVVFFDLPFNISYRASILNVVDHCPYWHLKKELLAPFLDEIGIPILKFKWCIKYEWKTEYTILSYVKLQLLLSSNSKLLIFNCVAEKVLGQVLEEAGYSRESTLYFEDFMKICKAAVASPEPQSFPAIEIQASVWRCVSLYFSVFKLIGYGLNSWCGVERRGMASASLFSASLCSSSLSHLGLRRGGNRSLSLPRRRIMEVVCGSDGIGEKSKGTAGEDEDKPSFNPFGFVTDNPSSRSAIQLPESPAEDGNVGQMLYRIEDKGKEYGSYVKSGKFRWFVRETGWCYALGNPDQFPQPWSLLPDKVFTRSSNTRGTILFIHGAPTQSFSYREVMSQFAFTSSTVQTWGWTDLFNVRLAREEPFIRTFRMADAGYHCFAPDWIGFGFSDKPQPGYGFSYTENEFHKVLDELLGTLNIRSPFFLVVQGFLVGSYGLTWALNNSSKISKLVILNSPLTNSSPLPGLFQKLRIPLYGEFTCQNAIIAERFIEAGSPYVCLEGKLCVAIYVLKSEKADVYRLPYLSSGGPGFGLYP